MRHDSFSLRSLRFAAALTVLSAVASAQGADDCANAQPITGLGPHAFDNTAATATMGLTDCNGVGVRKDVWFSWTAPQDARITISVCGQTTLAMRLAVYEGTCASLSQLVCMLDGCASGTPPAFLADGGQTYLFRFGSQFVGDSGTGTFTLTESIPAFNPANGSYYEVIQDNLSWTQARDRAETMVWQGRSGRLASMPGSQELDWVSQNLTIGRAWTGLYQDLTSPNYSEPVGGWRWLDGSAGFLVWSPGEPNNSAGGGGSEDHAEMFAGGVFNDVEDNHAFTDSYLVEYAVPLGTNYCMPNANSTGVPAVMSLGGSAAVALNTLTLLANDLPNNSFAFFLTSQNQGFVALPPGSSGNLCLAGNIGRYVGSGQIQQASAVGEITLEVSLNQIPTPNGLVQGMPGETWNFQAWYRDASPTGPTSNFTDGISVTLQ